MGGRGLLVYQPNHGVGMELVLVHHAARLARLLDRTVVLPLLPVLETTHYQGGLEEYFEPPRDLPCISTRELRERHGGRVDRLFHVIPHYQEEYRTQVVRDRHPVWLDNIENHPYFGLAGLTVGEVTRLDVHSPLTPTEALSAFDTDEPVLGFTYHHSLVTHHDEPERPDEDHLFWLHDVPPYPRSEFLRAVEFALGGRPSLALHVRRGSVDNAIAIHDVDLPVVEAFLEHVPADPGLLYVATDTPSALDRIREVVPDARQLVTGHFLRDTVLDLSACALADRFVGTHYSTFSHAVVHARRMLGRSPGSSLMLRETPRVLHEAAS